MIAIGEAQQKCWAFLFFVHLIKIDTMSSEKVKAKSVREFLVVKTFSGPKGNLHRAGDKVSFKSKKDEVHMVGMGYVEPAEGVEPKRKGRGRPKFQNS